MRASAVHYLVHELRGAVSTRLHALCGDKDTIANRLEWEAYTDTECTQLGPVLLCQNSAVSGGRPCAMVPCPVLLVCVCAFGWRRGCCCG